MATSERSSTMATVVAVQIVLQKLEILLSHPVCVECLSTQTRAKDANAKLATIQEFLSTQHRQSKTTEWSGRLLQAMYYAEEFIDKFHLREARGRHGALHMAARPLTTLVSKYKLWRDLSNLVNKMHELCQNQYLTGKNETKGERKIEPASSSSHASVPWQGKKLARLNSFWDQQVSPDFLYRKVEKDRIIEQFKKQAQSYFVFGTSIEGEQGVGKTLLARWAYNQAQYMDFEQRVWVHVSASMDIQEFLVEILKQVDKLATDVEDMDIEEIKAKLSKKLAEMKKLLIVLDDVQRSNEPLLRAFQACTANRVPGHIITTTRDPHIGWLMGYGENYILLEKLGNEESQRMLAWKLHRVSDGQRLSNEEKYILNMCHGLPLYVSLLGGFLSYAGEHERAALAKESSMMTMLDILQLSCHKLPVHLKPCFIYMTLFPIASPIPTRRLVRLWLAEGLLDSHCYDRKRETTRPPEDVGEMFILELADRNVIDVVSWRPDGSPKACQMLTSLYDMIRPSAMSGGFLHIHATSKSRDNNDRDPTNRQQQLLAQPRERTKIRRLAEHTNIVIDGRSGNYHDLNLGYVRTFLSFYLRRGMLTKDISMFLRKMTSRTSYSLLRVLDLEGVYKPSLHGVLNKLVLLRYLGLRSTVLDSLPSVVADLHHLETLDIKHTNITLLPSSFWKARNLRHLHLNWFYMDLKNILKACSNNVNALTQLQTLSGLVIGEVKENLMRNHMDSLTTLATLKLFLQHSSGDTSGSAEKAVADWISFRLTNLQSLTFGVIQEDQPTKEDKPEKEAKSMEEAEPTKEKPATWPIGPLPELSLAEQHHDLLELYLLGQLNKPIWTQLLPVSLRVLTLSGSNVEADMMPQLGNILRYLRTLRLLADSFLSTSLTFIKDGFPSLKILKIWKLPKLEKVVIEQGAMLHLKELEFRHLKTLTTVKEIKECKELENICVKSQSDAFVKTLQDQIKGENLNVKIDAKRSESTDDDDDDSGD